jgi:hypothetical protein
MKKQNSTKETQRLVKLALDYLITEGVVVKVGHKYRLKTKQEIQEELKKIEMGQF